MLASSVARSLTQVAAPRRQPLGHAVAVGHGVSVPLWGIFAVLRYLLIVPITAFAMLLGGSGSVHAASEVACGRVQDVRPATATTPGSFSLVAGQSTTVTLRAGETGLFAGYICIDADIVNGQWVFAGFIGPADARFISQIPSVTCGTLSPNTQTTGPRSGAEWVELRNAQGLYGLIDARGTARLSVPANVRPPLETYVCVRVGAAATFSEFVIPGADGYISPRTVSSLPNTSTTPVDSTGSAAY